MATPRLSRLFSNPRALSHDANVIVWSRSGSGANLVMMTENEIAFGAISESELPFIEQRLEQGESVLNVIGRKGKLIHFSSIQSITADLSNTDLIVTFQLRGRTKAVKFRFEDAIAQQNALDEAQTRMRGDTELFETTRSKLSYLMKPLNFVVFFVLFTALTHCYFRSDPFEATVNRKKYEDFRKQTELHRSALPGRPIAKPSAPRYEPSHQLSKNPIYDQCLKFGYMILGSLTLFLNYLGYSAVMSTLTFLTFLSLFYLFYRLTHPPRIRVLLNL